MNNDFIFKKKKRMKRKMMKYLFSKGNDFKCVIKCLKKYACIHSIHLKNIFR